jgi:hypothetical protein
MAAQQKFIPGIYNYCDRWCERCTFTSRCRNYESTSKLSPEQLDINNKTFWDNISSNFSKAIELLHKAAKEHGIDLDKAMTKEEKQEYEKRESFLKKATENHKLIKLCRKYEETARPFLKKNHEFVDKTRELLSELEMGLKTEEQVVHSVANIRDCLSRSFNGICFLWKQNCNEAYMVNSTGWKKNMTFRKTAMAALRYLLSLLKET